MTPGVAFSRAYLPARRMALEAQQQLLAHATPKSDARRLVHAISAKATDADARLAQLPADPSSSPLVSIAKQAGMSARRVAVAAEVLALLAQLRFESPKNDDLRALAAKHADDLRQAVAELTNQLRSTGLPLVVARADSIEDTVSRMRNLEPTTYGGFDELRAFANRIYTALETKAQQLDTAPPPKATSAPTADEDALFARIIANPGDYALRARFAELASRRNDPRAVLIREQLAGESRHDLIVTHPEWKAALEQLGARDVKFAGGFPEEIHIDADSFLARGAALKAAAPITRVHIRNAKGRVASIVRSPLLAKLEALDLDDAGVTDDDIIALAASPHAANLKQLDLRFNPLTPRGIEAIAASRHLEHLEVATFDGNPADPTDRKEYFSETSYDYVPTEAGKALERKYGPLRWLHRR
ncbi:MAG: hypothetical protein ACXVEE_30445 [Polyangiales bacterium]